ELNAVAQLVAVGVVDLPTYVHDAVVLGRLAATLDDPLLRLVRDSLLVRRDFGHDGPKVLGDERKRYAGYRGAGAIQARAHLREAPSRAWRHGPLGNRATPRAPRSVGRLG